MAIVTTNSEHYQAIADAIRLHTGEEYKYYPEDMYLGVSEVYDAGFEAGKAEGGGGSYEEGFEAGKQVEHDSFWDTFQQNGSRTDYQNAFRGAWWTDANFKPKYDIAPTGNCGQIFESSGITDLKGICEAQGITFDFSQVTYTASPLNNSKITRMPTYNVSSIPNLQYICRSASNLVWIDKIVLSEDGTQTFGTGTGNHAFLYASKLSHCPFEGTIGTSIWFNGNNLLDDETIQSIIDCLADLSGQTAQTLTFHATVGAKLTNAQKATIATKNWTLVY